MEKEVLVKGRPEDQEILQEVAGEAAAEFTALIKSQTGADFKTTVNIDSKSFLTEHHTK